MTQDEVGPIARTVTDAALLLDVMAGYDPADPIRLDYRVSRGDPESFVGGIPRIGGMKGGKAALWSDSDMADTFAKKAAEGGMAEVELGRLAADKGASDQVKKFGYESIEISGEPEQYKTKETRALLNEHGIRCWGAVTLMLGERNLAA